MAADCSSRGRPLREPSVCGRYLSALPAAELARVFKVFDELPNYAPSWNVAPTARRPVVRTHPETRRRRLDLLTWGFVPSFTKDLKTARKPINARAETVASSGTFRGAFEKRRCLVAADGFYEWRQEADGKQPFAIARKDGRPMALAGVWEGWRAADGEVLRTYTIITTAANDDMHALHNRMPLVLEERGWPVWLGEETGDVAGLLAPPEAGTLRLWPVSRAVNSVRNDWPELVVPRQDDNGGTFGGGPNSA